MKYLQKSEKFKLLLEKINKSLLNQVILDIEEAISELDQYKKTFKNFHYLKIIYISILTKKNNKI